MPVLHSLHRARMTSSLPQRVNCRHLTQCTRIVSKTVQNRPLQEIRQCDLYFRRRGTVFSRARILYSTINLDPHRLTVHTKSEMQLGTYHGHKNLSIYNTLNFTADNLS